MVVAGPEPPQYRQHLAGGGRLGWELVGLDHEPTQRLNPASEGLVRMLGVGGIVVKVDDVVLATLRDGFTESLPILQSSLALIVRDLLGLLDQTVVKAAGHPHVDPFAVRSIGGLRQLGQALEVVGIAVGHHQGVEEEGVGDGGLGEL